MKMLSDGIVMESLHRKDSFEGILSNSRMFEYLEKPTIHSAVVAVGEELLSGQTTDTNGSWLSQRLASLGAPVFRRWVVGDRPSEIQDAVRAAVDVAELVIVTGGLGPT